MKQLLWTCAAVALTLFALVPFARADEPATAATQTSQEARIAELEKKLAAAIVRIEALEADAAKRQPSASGVATGKQPARSTTTKPLTPGKKVDESVSYFPKGTQVTGTMSSPKTGNIAMKGSVITRTSTTAVLRMTNTFGTRDFEVAIKNGDAALASTRVVNVANGGPPNQLLDIKIKGKADAETLKLSGTWHVKGPAGSYATDVEFDLKAN
jgi:hypothetical protein